MSKWLEHQWASIVLLIVVVVLSSIGCSMVSQEPVPIRIGVIAPLSGELASYGQDMRNAAALAIEDFQTRGGLMLGGQPHEVVLLFEDDQDNPEVAVSVARKLINQDKVVTLVGPPLSRNAIPVANAAEQAQVPMISPSSTNPETTHKKQYVFRAGFIDPFQGTVLAHFARTRLKSRRAAVLYDVASAYNHDLAEFFQQAFEQSGGKVVAFEAYTTGTEDFREQLTIIRDSKADVLFLPNYSNEVPTQARQAYELGIDATLLGSDTWTIISVDDRAILEGAFFSSHFASDADQEQVRAFVAAYQEHYGQLPSDVAALTYDTFGLLFAAMENQGKADAESIRLGLSGLEDYPGVTGTISYEQGGDPRKSAVIIQIRDGQMHYYTTIRP